MEIFDLREFDGHELIVFGHDPGTSLRAIIAIHSTALGPAAGGCRMWPYATTAEAVCDVLRLSRGMSYKNALAGVPFGGGKAVIIGESRKAKTPELFEAFGRCRLPRWTLRHGRGRRHDEHRHGERGACDAPCRRPRARAGRGGRGSGAEDRVRCVPGYQGCG